MKGKSKIFSIGSLFRSGWQLPVYLFAALLPTLLLAVSLTVHFVNTQLEEENRILSMGFAQMGNQLSYLYNSSSTLAQNLSVNTTLNNQVLTTKAQKDDFLLLNKNILSLHQLADGIHHSGTEVTVRFYLPATQIIPDNHFLFTLDAASTQPWYPNLSARLFHRKWYVTTHEKHRYLSYVYPLQHPYNFLEITGFLSVDMDIQVVEQLFEDSMAIPGTLMALKYQNELIYASETISNVQKEILSCLDDEAFSLRGSSYEIDGKSYMVFAVSVDLSDMTLICCVPRGAMSENLSRGYYTQLLLMVVEVLMLLVISFFFASSVVRRQRSELKMLNYQINPHFLYNTLDMINWQAIDQDNPAIYQPIQALSRFYKIMLNHGQEYIMLSDELLQIRLYLDLQNMRFHDGISYSIQAPAEVCGCRMLHLVLQPIVENAVMHGIRESGKQCGRIDVTCTAEKGVMTILIEDDGVGIPPQQQKHLLSRASSKGYGLSNVHQRIRLVYGAGYGLTLSGNPGEGTTVRVTLPLRRDELTESAIQPIHYTNRTN